MYLITPSPHHRAYTECTDGSISAYAVVMIVMYRLKAKYMVRVSKHHCAQAFGGEARYLRVEFLLKTDSGYPKDTGVNLFE